MDKINDEQIEELDDDYTLVIKNQKDILNDINFENDLDKLICESIITDLEASAYKSIKDNKVVQIPFIGCIRINTVKRKFSEAKKEFSAIRKSLSKNQYREHVKSYYMNLAEEQEKKDRLKLVLNRIKRNNRDKYDKAFKRCGKAYAEMFIYSIYLLKEVAFDAEWEEHYQSLKD